MISARIHSCRLVGVLWLLLIKWSVSQADVFQTVSVWKTKVMDKSGRALPYVNVGVVGKPIGTVSDTDGNVTLNLTAAVPQDSVRISLLGYKTQLLSVMTLLSQPSRYLTISLEEHSVVLKEVIISAVEPLAARAGRTSEKGLIQATFNANRREVNEKLGTEIGMRIQVKHKPALIRDFNWYLSANGFSHIKFRVNVYAVRENMPDTLIIQRDTFAEVNGKTGWQKIDLLPLNIVVSDDFVVSLQWIEHKIASIEKPPAILIPGTLSPFSSVYFRDGSQDRWKKFGASISYYVTLLH